jgi:hypothetical protein
MKLKLTTFVTVLFLSIWSLSINAQTIMPKGKAQLIEFTNTTAKFTVPDGKAWYICNVFSDYRIDCKLVDGRLTGSSTRVLLKSLNGVVKTDITKNQFGTQLFMSTDASLAISMPLILPEKTTFELILMSGDAFSDIKLYSGKGYLNIIETDN